MVYVSWYIINVSRDSVGNNDLEGNPAIEIMKKEFIPIYDWKS